MRRFATAILPAVVVVLFAASVASAADSCPAPCTKVPSNSRYVSVGGTPLPPFPGAALPGMVATLKKGKPKRVVVVEAMMKTGVASPGFPVTLNMFPDVNGVLMEPDASGGVGGPGPLEDCGGFGINPPAFSCTLTGTWWLDLDAAEAANPGVFINQPLAVTLRGGDFAGMGLIPVDVTMSVRLEKK